MALVRVLELKRAMQEAQRLVARVPPMSTGNGHPVCY